MLNYVFKRGSWVAGYCCWILFSLHGMAATNDWIKPGSGKWEESAAWSAGLPSVAQELVAIRNPGWKAVEIRANTAGDAPGSLQLQNLLVEAPVDSFNNLLLNWAGTAVPLTIQSNIQVGSRGQLESHSSGLNAGSLTISNGAASFMDASAATIGGLTLQSQGEVTLDGSVLLTLSNFVSAVFTQNSGTHYVGVMQLAGEQIWANPGLGRYLLKGGVVLSSNIVAGPPQAWQYGKDGIFEQTGGAHTNTIMSLRGWIESVRYSGYVVHHSGAYKLFAGNLQSDNLEISTGAFFQKGGSARIPSLKLTVGGLYSLGSGELLTSNVWLVQNEPYYSTTFEQTGGVHTVQNELRMSGADYYRRISYQLSSGVLNANRILADTSAVFTVTGGDLSNSEVWLRKGTIEVGNGLDVHFGTLNAYYGALNIDPAGYEGPSVVRFDDSSSVNWDGTNGLVIENWHPTYDHVYFGTSAQGLTAAQLAKITFWHPIGWPTDYPQGTYAATMLPSGEVVPVGAGTSGDFTYMVLNGNAVITGYKGTAGKMVIPSVIDGYPVTGIGDSAFLNCGVITEAVVPGSVKHIGPAAFQNCTNMGNLTLSEGLLSIERETFSRCSQLQAVTIPNSVTNVGYDAFIVCSNLQSIVFGAGLDEIQSGMFLWCTRLKTVTLPPALKYLGSSSFYFCTELQNLPLPATLYSIGDLAFYGSGLTHLYIPAATTNAGLNSMGYCTNLLSIGVDPANPAYRSIDGVLFDKSAKTLLKYATGRSGPYTVPYGVETIYNWAFEYSPYLTAVYVPSTVTYIAYSVFDNCPSLTGVYFYGSAPSGGDSLSGSGTIYYLPGTPGWPINSINVQQSEWQLPYPVILSATPDFGISMNEFRFRISWSSNAPVVVEASALVEGPWIPVSTNSLSSGWTLFSQPVQQAQGGHFYRVRGL